MHVDQWFLCSPFSPGSCVPPLVGGALEIPEEISPPAMFEYHYLIPASMQVYLFHILASFFISFSRVTYSVVADHFR